MAMLEESQRYQRPPPSKLELMMKQATKEERLMLDTSIRDVKCQGELEAEKAAVIGLVGACPILKAFNESRSKADDSAQREDGDFSAVSRLNEALLPREKAGFIKASVSPAGDLGVQPAAPKTGTHRQTSGAFANVLSTGSRHSHSREGRI